MDFLKAKNNRGILLLLAASFLFSCESKTSNSELSSKDSSKAVQSNVLADEYLVSDSGFGAVNRRTTYQDLEKLYGKENLEDAIDYAPEGLDSFTVTKIFSNTPREIIVGWEKGKLHKTVSSLDFVQENSPYHTSDSLRVGSTLEELVRANGKKISFYGTGWDYGGLITSYHNGRFEKSYIFFFLDSKEDAEGVMGDQELNTDMPKVKANLKKLFISKISVSFLSR